MTTVATKRLTKKELAAKAAKTAKKLGLAKPMPSAKAEKVAKSAKQVKAKSVEKAAEVVEVKPVEKVEVAKAATVARDGWGRRMDTGTHCVNVALIEAGDNGTTAKELVQAAAKVAERLKLKARGAVDTHLQFLKGLGHVSNEGGKWKVTVEGLKAWSGK